MTAAVRELAPRAGRVRGRDFRLLWAGETTSTLGTSVTSVALPLVAVTALDATAFQVATLTAATWLPWLLIGLPAGAWVDRLPPRPVMITCDVISLALYGSVPLAAVAGALSVPYLLVVALGAGAAGVFFKTSYQVLLPDLVPKDELAAGNARLQGTEAVTQVGGPGLAGLIAGSVGAMWALMFDALTFLVSAVCLAAVRPVSRRRPPTRRAPLRREVAEGIRFVVRDPYLRVFALFGAVSNLGLVAYQSVLVVFLIRDVGLDATAVGGVVAAMSVGGVIGAFVGPALGRRLGTARAILLCQAVAMPSALLIPLTGPGARLATAVAGGVLVGAGVVAGNVIKGSWRQAYTPPPLLGRVVSCMHLVNFGTMPLGALAGGALASWLGVRGGIWCAAIWLTLTCGVLLAGPLRHRRDLPDHPHMSAFSARRSSACGSLE